MSVLNQTAMSSTCGANTLERCVVMRSVLVLSHVTAPPCFTSLLWSRFLLPPHTQYGWCYLFVTFISYCMMYKKRLLTSSYAEYFCHFQTAWWLAAFNARTMLFEGCDSCYHSLVTYVRPCTAERGSFIFKHAVFFKHSRCR